MIDFSISTAMTDDVWWSGLGDVDFLYLAPCHFYVCQMIPFVTFLKFLLDVQGYKVVWPRVSGLREPVRPRWDGEGNM